MFQIDVKSPAGQFLSDRNRLRQYDFLETSFLISNAGFGLEIDHDFICSLNLYATQYIAPQSGRYRRHYDVEVNEHKGVHWPLVQDQMDLFVDNLHRRWASYDPIQAASYALWGINNIHPFCDGNGRTARALSYFVLCKKVSGWLPGKNTMIEAIRNEAHDDMCRIMQTMHSNKVPGTLDTDLTELSLFLNDLVLKQIADAANAANNPSTDGTP